MVNPAEINPANVKLDEQERIGLQPRSEKLYTATVVEKNKLDVKSIKNVTGTILIISDLRTEVNPEGVVLQPNQVIDLVEIFEPKEINRSMRLKEAIKIGAVAVVETCSNPGELINVPDVKSQALNRKTTPEDVNRTMPRNEYDDKFAELGAEEKIRNKNQSQEANRDRK